MGTFVMDDLQKKKFAGTTLPTKSPLKTINDEADERIKAYKESGGELKSNSGGASRRRSNQSSAKRLPGTSISGPVDDLNREDYTKKGNEKFDSMSLDRRNVERTRGGIYLEKLRKVEGFSKMSENNYYFNLHKYGIKKANDMLAEALRPAYVKKKENDEHVKRVSDPYYAKEQRSRHAIENHPGTEKYYELKANDYEKSLRHTDGDDEETKKQKSEKLALHLINEHHLSGDNLNEYRKILHKDGLESATSYAFGKYAGNITADDADKAEYDKLRRKYGAQKADAFLKERISQKVSQKWQEYTNTDFFNDKQWQEKQRIKTLPINDRQYYKKVEEKYNTYKSAALSDPNFERYAAAGDKSQLNMLYGRENYDVGSKFKYLTDEEYKLYTYYLAKNGSDTADEFIKNLSGVLNVRRREGVSKRDKAAADKNGVYATAKSLALKPFGDAAALVNTGFQALADARGGSSYVPSEVVAARNYSAVTSNNLHDFTRDNIKSDGLKLAYDVGYGVADNVIGAVIYKSFYPYIKTALNAGNKMQRNLDNGASAGAAFLNGAAYGVIDYFANKLTYSGIEKMVANPLERTSVSAIRDICSNIAAVGGRAALADGGAALAQNVAETMILKDKSEFYRLSNYLAANGATRDEAVKSAAYELYFKEPITNALSTLAFSGISAGVENASAAIGRSFSGREFGEYDNIAFPDKSEYINARYSDGVNGKKFNSYGAGEYDNIAFPDKSEYVNAPRSGSYNYWSQNPYGAGDFDDIAFPHKSNFTDNAGNFDYEQLIKDVDTYGKSKKQRLTNRGVGDIIKETANNLKNNAQLQEISKDLAKTAVSAVTDGLIQGYISDTNGGDFKKGFAEGFASGIISGGLEFANDRQINTNTNINKATRKVIYSGIGNAVTSLVSNLFSEKNYDSDEKTAEKVAKETAESLVPAISSEAIDLVIQAASESSSAAQELLLGFDEKFAKVLAVFFQKLIVAVDAERKENEKSR